MWHDMWADGWMMHGGTGVWMTIILGLGIFAFFAVLIGRAMLPSTSNGAPNDALDILDRRFANGEIAEDEYEEKRAKLREDA